MLSIVVYLAYFSVSGEVEIARTALIATLVLCGLVLISFVEPPTEGWVGGDTLSGDWRPTLLALGMLGLFILIMVLEPLRVFFELSFLGFWDVTIIAGGVMIWAFLLRFIWRSQIFRRFFGLKISIDTT
jgi:cation-transporting ATPase E